MTLRSPRTPSDTLPSAGTERDIAPPSHLPEPGLRVAVLIPCFHEAAAIAREKVHRAAVALEWIARSGIKLTQSLPGARGLGVPEPQ